MAKTKLHLAEVVTNPNIAALPLDKTIYVTVRAYNKAGKLKFYVPTHFTINIINWLLNFVMSIVISVS